MNRPHLAPIRAMLAQLSHDDKRTLAAALHQHLFAPPPAAELRVRELGLLARLLDEEPQDPERLPYVERRRYDERRARDQSEAPASARLVERFGTWQRACRSAWGLLPDGRSSMGGSPYPRRHAHRRRPAKYTEAEAIASVRLCRDTLGRWPSSGDYHTWSLAQRRRAFVNGREVRIARMSIVLRLLASSDAPPGANWASARARALGPEPTANEE
jgi:hypothetical protein